MDKFSMEDVQIVVDLVSLAEALWAIGGAVIGVLGTIIFGRRYKERLAAMEAKADAPTVNVNIETSSPRPRGGAPVDPTATPRISSSPDERLHDLESLIAAHATGESFSHDRIWELHFALGEIGIPWPGPGITPAFRRAISEEILAACRDGDLERARAAWATVKARESG